MKFTFSPARYHTSLAEIREIMSDTAGIYSETDSHGNITIHYKTPLDLQIVFLHLGLHKKKEPAVHHTPAGPRKKNNQLGKREITIVLLSVLIAAIVLALQYCR